MPRTLEWYCVMIAHTVRKLINNPIKQIETFLSRLSSYKTCFMSRKTTKKSHFIREYSEWALEADERFSLFFFTHKEAKSKDWNYFIHQGHVVWSSTLTKKYKNIRAVLQILEFNLIAWKVIQTWKYMLASKCQYIVLKLLHILANYMVFSLTAAKALWPL